MDDQATPFRAGRYYDRRAVQETLGLSPRGLDTWLARERVTAYRLSGRVIRYDGSELAEALSRAARREPTPPSGACARTA